MRVGAANLFGGGCSIAEGAVWPDRRKRGGVAGLPCSDGCSRSLAEFAAIAVGVCAVVVGVCAVADGGDKPITAKMMKPATADARQRRLPGDRLAPKARTSANVRVTSEAAKANHRHGALGGARPFPCGNRAIPAPAAKLAPMVNGVRTDMVNERLIRDCGPRHSAAPRSGGITILAAIRPSL